MSRNRNGEMDDSQAMPATAEWWKSVEEYVQAAPDDSTLDEFPAQVIETGGLSFSRRDFMKLMGASMALAGISGCSAPADEEIAPYVHPPAQGVEGEARHYATAVTLNGVASGVVATTYMGRPVKLEGNPRHPANAGATDIFTQAAILQLWDPDRSALLLRQDTAASWDDLVGALRGRLGTLQEKQGSGLHVLTGNVGSPSLAAQLQALQRSFPKAEVHSFEPICDDQVEHGAELAFGEPLQTSLRLDRARCVLSLESDFLGPGPDQVRYAKQFSQARRSGQEHDEMVRLYAVETFPTVTGAAADHRNAMRSVEIEGLARALARRLGAKVEAPDQVAVPQEWLNALVDDLRAHAGRSLVVAGRRQPAAVHALAHWINHQLGSAGTTVEYRRSVRSRGRQMEALRTLSEAMRNGQVDTLLVIGSNPVYAAPADVKFAEALRQVPLSIHLGLYQDETARLCTWHVPAAHELESWGDARAADGTVSIQQPLIAPLYDGHSAQELLAAANGQVAAGSRELVRDYWRAQWGEQFESKWKQALRTGVVADSAAALASPTIRADMLARLQRSASEHTGLEINFAPDATVWDGRYANNAWLQELPKPMTQLTWDNAAYLSPATAKAHGIENEQILVLRYHGQELRAPAWIAPGHADEAITLSLGYGRKSAGSVGNDAGVDANRLRRSTAPWFDGGLELQTTDDRYPLATTQVHHRLHDRHMVREATLDEYRRNPEFAKRGESGPPPSLYPPYAYDGYAWGMVVNLNTCIGCGACTIACQAENNIPVVGKKQVRLSREMHWIRIDRYYKGPIEDPETYFQPVPCMQCEHAPCELVCPVGATMHDSEGLNVQVYNRCIGTRFCSNNCPYKVRRFNFLQYADHTTPSLAAQRNPEVTVRMRGVMEKCTYCVQRINRTRIAAQRNGEPIRDGEVKTACQQVCPTDAIVFGDINDPDTQVSKEKKSPLDYTMLEELNTRPRTTYTAKLRNPNAALRKRS